MKRFLQRLAGFSLGPVLGAAISFLLFPIFINILPVEEYGRAGVFQNILIQIPNFVYLGLDQAYTREFHHHKDKRRLMQHAMLPALGVGLLLAVISIIFARPIAEWTIWNPDYYYIVHFAAIWILVTIVERFIQLSIRMEEKAMEYSFFTLLLKVGNFIVSMLLIWMGIRDFRVVLYGLIFGHIIADVFLFYRYRHLLDFSGLRINRELMEILMRFGLPIMIAASLSALLNLVDTVSLNSLSDSYNIGIYKAGSQLAAVFGILKTAFASFWVPTAYRWYEEGRSMKHYKYISDALMLILSMGFFLLLLLKHPITVFLNPNREYIEFQYIAGLLAFPHLMYTLSETTTLGIVFSRKTFYNIIVSVLALAVSVGVNLLLTPSLGFRGAALASTLAYAVFYLARTYFSSRTGFYFGQRTQIVTMLLMIGAGILNLYPNSYSIIGTLGIALLALIIQIPTLKTTYSVITDSDSWDFT